MCNLTDCGIATDDVSLIEPFRMSLQCRFSIHYGTQTHGELYYQCCTLLLLIFIYYSKVVVEPFPNLTVYRCWRYRYA